LLPDDNLEEGSDILILRRADTAVFTGNPNTNEVYIQANAQTANLMMGNSSADVPTDSADDGTTANLLKYPSKTGNTTIADTRKYHVHLYFIAPCSRGSGANDICVDGVDDEIPTLKRLELTQDGGTTVMDIVPLVEGIEFMKFEYGIDDNPSTVNDVTGLQGDGVPDTYVTSPSVAQMSQIVSVKVHLLARSPDETTGFADAKQYTLAGNVIAAPGDAYKRHVFSSEIRLMNLGGRREIPE
jgi:type IV pilus assembly protein PilW